MVTVIRHDSNIPDFLIVYAIEFAVFVYNRVPVEALDWITRWEKATGAKPDVSRLQRFGCLCRVLKPLELRKHKFDAYTEDCCYLGPCPLGKGTRFVRLSNSKVYVRDDCVVYNDVMPFRSTGGKGSPLSVRLSSAAEHDVFWDQDEVVPRTTPTELQTTMVPVASPGPTTMVSPGSTTIGETNRSVPISPVPYSSPNWSPGGTSDSGYTAFDQSRRVQRGGSPLPPTAQAREGESIHGTNSTRTSRGEWRVNHCSNSNCIYPANHEGPCSDAVTPLTQGAPSQNTRLAKVQATVMPPIPEHQVDDLDEGQKEHIGLEALSVVLHDSYTMPAPRAVYLAGDPIADATTAYQTCVDAFVSSVDVRCVDSFVASRKLSNKTKKAKTNAMWSEHSGFEYEIASIRVELGIATAEDHAVVNRGNPPKSTGRAFNTSLALPHNLGEAINHPNWHAEQGYRYATIRELKSWVKHKVLEDRGDPPSDATLLNLSLLYSFKTGKKGEFDRAKLRIIVVGHKWAAKKGEHYFHNFSHTVAWPNLRGTLAQACNEKFTIAKQWDSHAAFLYADPEPGAMAYARVPPELMSILSLPSAAFVAKAAYGLPSAPAGWGKFSKRVLTHNCNLTVCKHDESVFVRRRGKEFIFVCTWVDDYCVLSNSEALYNETRDKYFSVVDGDEGPLEYLLGVNVDVNYEAHSIKLYSEKAIKAMLQKYGEPRHPSAVPCRQDLAELRDLSLPERGSPTHTALKERAARFLSLSHAILYAATTTRPDIAYTIGVLLRAGDNPTEQHLEALEVLLAYLMGTTTMGVMYKYGAEVTGLTSEYSALKDGLTSLSDSDWSTGKSISGYVAFLAGGPFLWASKLQPITSISSTEAEYYAASACAAAIIAFRLFLGDLGAEPFMPTPVFIDNSACVDLARDFKSCKRAKHIDRRVNFLTDYQEAGHIETMPIGTSENTADVFTKPLAKTGFKKHAATLMTP